MKCVTEGIPIKMCFAGTKIELALVSDSVVIEATAVLKNVESPANVELIGERDANFRPRA